MYEIEPYTVPMLAGEMTGLRDRRINKNGVGTNLLSGSKSAIKSRKKRDKKKLKKLAEEGDAFKLRMFVDAAKGRKASVVDEGIVDDETEREKERERSKVPGFVEWLFSGTRVAGSAVGSISTALVICHAGPMGAVGAGVAGVGVAGRVLGVAGRVGAGVVCGEGLPTRLLVFYHWIAGLQWIFFVHCF